MSYYPHGHGTPENKIAQFAHLGLMPSKFKGASFLPYMWNKSTDDTVELDASHKDRLSRSAQKKFRRWSRRLNGGNSTGTGWVLKDGQQATNQPSSLQDEYSVFYQAYQEIRYGRYDSSLSNSPSSGDHTSGSNSPGTGCEYSYSQRVQHFNSSQRVVNASATIQNHQRSKSQGSYPRQSTDLNSRSPDSPVRWYSRSERRFRVRKEIKHYSKSHAYVYQAQSDSYTEMGSNSEVGPEGSVTIQRYGSDAPDDSSQLYTRRERTRSKSLGRFECDQRSSEGANELFHRRPLTDTGKLSSAKSPDRRKDGLTQSSNVVDKESPSNKSICERGKFPDPGTIDQLDGRTQSPINLSIHGRRKESPLKRSCSGAVNFTLDAATFFGTNKEKSRTPSAGTEVSLQKNDKPISNSIIHPKRALVSNRRESSQSAGGGRVSTKSGESSKVEETPKNLGLKSSKKAAAREQQERTPISVERPSNTDLTDVIELKSSTKLKSDESHKMIRRSSPHKGDIKPKALIKPGLRSAKKDPRKSFETRRTPAKTETSTNGTRFVQRTLDSFFSAKPSPCLQKSASYAGIDGRSEESKSRHGNESRSARKRSKDHSRRSEKDGTRKRSSNSSAGEGHVRRIYQDDEQSRPVVRLTLLKEDQLWKVTSNSATEDRSSSADKNTLFGRRSGTARFAEVSPIPSPAKKRGCKSPAREETPPLKAIRRSPSRRDSCESIEDAKASQRDIWDSALAVNPKKEKSRDDVSDTSPPSTENCDSSADVIILERSPSRKKSKGSRSSKNHKQSKRGSGDSKDLKVMFGWDAPSRRESANSRASEDLNEVMTDSPGRTESCVSSKDLRSSRRESCDSSKGASPTKKDSCYGTSSRRSPPRLRSSPAKVAQLSPVKKSVVPLTKSPTKMTPSKKANNESRKSGNTNGQNCNLSGVLPMSPTKKALSPSKACPAPATNASPAKVVRRTPVKVQVDVTQEDELAQARRDEAARKTEADQAAQRNKKRHTRGRKVFAYCDVLDEHIERHPIQNEIPANKWHKWLNPSQLRCLTLIMLDNKDLCLNFSHDGARNEEWEAAWVKLATRLNTVCYSELTRLNTGLRMTVSEWKDLWLEMKTTVRSRVEAMKPEARRHSLGSLDCLLFSQDLYSALIESNGECLGKDCPRIWCSGACVGVMPPAELPARKLNEE